MLESGEYDSPQSLARAIVKHCYATILERDWSLAVVKLSDDGTVYQTAFGLFASPAEAEKLASQLGRPFMVIPVTSGDAFTRRIAEMDGQEKVA